MRRVSRRVYTPLPEAELVRRHLARVQAFMADLLARRSLTTQDVATASWVSLDTARHCLAELDAVLGDDARWRLPAAPCPPPVAIPREDGFEVVFSGAKGQSLLGERAQRRHA